MIPIFVSFFFLAYIKLLHLFYHSFFFYIMPLATSHLAFNKVLSLSHKLNTTSFSEWFFVSFFTTLSKECDGKITSLTFWRNFVIGGFEVITNWKIFWQHFEQYASPLGSALMNLGWNFQNARNMLSFTYVKYYSLCFKDCKNI